MRRWVVGAAALAVFMALSTRAGAAPSTALDDYALFAGSALTAKSLRVDRGDVGVNAGSLQVRDALDAPTSVVAGSTVVLRGRASCATLFASSSTVGGSGCGPAEAFVAPIVPDLATACGLDDETTACDAADPVEIGRDETRTLDPGVYGDVNVRAGAGHAGRVILTGGDYVFCSLRAARYAVIQANAPVRVLIDRGDVRLSTGSSIAPGGAATAADVVIHATGAGVTFGRRATIRARLCAPTGELRLEDDVTLEGSFVAGTIRARRISASGLGEAPTTTTISTTTSTAPVSSTTSTTSTPSTSTTSTLPTTTTTAPTLTSTTSSIPVSTTTSSTHATTTTTSSTLPTTSTTSTTTTTTTSSTTTTSGRATTSSTSSTTTTTSPVATTTTLATFSCPASKLVDATVTLVPALNGSTHSPVGGAKVELDYPATVSLPGTGALPVNDPTDPATRETMIDLDLYNGFVFFFDTDTALQTSVAGQAFSLGAPYPFELARFDCAAGATLVPGAFTCAVTDESDTLGGGVAPGARPACAVTIAPVP